MPVVEGAPDLYGKVNSFSPEALCASDLDIRLCGDVANALLWAAKEWGNVGAIEYYVMGVEESAADSLIEVFCNRRDERNNWSRSECINRSSELPSEYSMKSYHTNSAAWLAEGSAAGTMGHNGGREWNMHNFTSSVPWGFDSSYDVGSPRGTSDQQTVFHEYFHAVQHNSHLSYDWDERDRKMWHRWFAEGSADYMAALLAGRLTSAGLLESRLSEIAGKGAYEFVNEMTEKLNRAKADFINCGGNLGDTGRGGKCDTGDAAYSGGVWAHVYLEDKHGDDVLMDVFYANLDAMEPEDAFALAYGQTVEEFYVEFEQFLSLPLSQQLSILPSI